MIKKYWKGAAVAILTFALGAALVLGLLWFVNTFKFEDEPVITMGPITTQAIAGPKVPYYAFLETKDIVTPTWYLLVDLSDATNYPHVGTTSINLKQIQHSGVLSNATHWDIKFGVVITVGTTNSLIKWIHTDHRVRTTQYHWNWDLPEHGLDLSIKNEEELRFVASVETTNTAFITTSTAISSPVEAAGAVTTTAGIGDLIMYVEEVGPSGHISHTSVGISYNTQ